MAAQKKAQELGAKLQKGEECEAAASEFLAMLGPGTQIPDGLVLAAIGNRGQNVTSCPKTLQTLLAGRADPNSMDQMTNSPVIHSACWHGSLDAVKLLLDFRANLEAKESKMQTPPLNTALAAGNAKICLELLSRGADVMWKHHDGATPLHVATAWIASSHNANLRVPPMGEEPRQVIAAMLRNGVDPTQAEGMTRSEHRSVGKTPLESFRQEIARSPWRTDPQVGDKFDKNARVIHILLEQAEEAVKQKDVGNKAFKEKRNDDALRAWKDARGTWEKAEVVGHHSAVLWNNEALCRRTMGDDEGAKAACRAGLALFALPTIKAKLEHNLAESEKVKIAPTPEEIKKTEEKIVELKEKKVKQKEEFKDLTQKVVKSEGGIYGEVGSAQKDYKVPPTFICGMSEAQDMGLGPPPAPAPWWEAKDADSDDEPPRTCITYLPAHHPKW